MADTELCYLPATEVMKRFRDHTLSPVEYLDALIARHREVEPAINATTYSFHEQALEQARKAETKFMRTGASIRRLEGLPVMIKDLHAIKGRITSQSCRIFADHRDTFTLPTVERLLRAGAILFARSTSSELGIATVCHSTQWGITRNPWNLAMSPGGSSGGSGAALAAGMTPLADGSDYGGSIRVPASACGVFGYKPPYGRNPQDTTGSFDSYCHYGPMTRTVADAAAMQNVMSGQHRDDLTTLPGRITVPDRPGSIRGWKIALSMNLGYKEIDPEVEHWTRRAAEVFRDLGCEVDEVDPGWTSASVVPWEVQSKSAVALSLAPHLMHWRYDILADSVRDAEQGMAMSARELFATHEIRAEMWLKLSPIMQRYDVMLCPTLGIPSVAADHSIFDTRLEINGTRVDPYMGWCLTYPFNALSQLPVASVPTGFASNGVPTGMQIVGRPYDDVSVFRAALAFEESQPWFAHNSPRPGFRYPDVD